MRFPPRVLLTLMANANAQGLAGGGCCDRPRMSRAISGGETSTPPDRIVGPAPGERNP
ncbi:MAG: hypothetical protein ACKJSK_18530 [Roseibacillus sp.]